MTAEFYSPCRCQCIGQLATRGTTHRNKRDFEASQISAWTESDGWIAHETVVYPKDECRDRGGEGSGGSQRDDRSIDQACGEHVISCLMDLAKSSFGCLKAVHAAYWWFNQSMLTVLTGEFSLGC